MKAAVELGHEHVAKLAIYEGPFTSDPVVLKEWQDYGEALHEAVKSDNTDGNGHDFHKARTCRGSSRDTSQR